MRVLSLEIGRDTVDGQVFLFFGFFWFFFWGEGEVSGSVEVSVQRAENGGLRGLRVWNLNTQSGD